jgi:hypothetical protein
MLLAKLALGFCAAVAAAGVYAFSRRRHAR